MLEPGLDRHEWESEWQALEPEHGDAPADALPEVDDLVARMLEERGYALDDPVAREGEEREVVAEFLAARLAQNRSATVLLHGDLSPSNILDASDARGLVAIDPAPCLGDAAFDAIDLILWQADDVETIKARVEMVASAIDGDAERLLDWCRAFAGMNAIELAGSPLPSAKRIRAAATLAAQAPTA